MLKLLTFFLIPPMWAVLTDTNPHLQPAAPPQPARGYRYTDPTFNTTVVRLTDATDGGRCSIVYNNWAVWAANKQRLAVYCDAALYIYDLDPSTFAAIGRNLVPNYSGAACTVEEVWMSRLRADILYCACGTNLTEYNMSTRTHTLIANIQPLMPAWYPSMILKRLCVDWAEDRFSMKVLTSDFSLLDFVVYDRSSNSVVRDSGLAASTYRGAWNVATAYLVGDSVAATNQRAYIATAPTTGDDPTTDGGAHWSLYGEDYKIQMTRDGTYLARAKGHPWDIINIDTGVVTPFPVSADHMPGHGDYLTTGYIGYGDGGASPRGMSWTFPTFAFTVHFTYGRWVDIQASTFGGDRYPVFTVSNGQTAVPPPGTYAYDEEIFEWDTVAGTVRRYVHHRSTAVDYWNIPHANVSWDRTLIAYNSDWGGTRGDVYIILTGVTPPVPVPLTTSLYHTFTGLFSMLGRLSW